MQDADKEKPQECGIERYFYTPWQDGDSCLLKQVRGYEVEVLPKTIPVREVTLRTYFITIVHDTAHRPACYIHKGEVRNSLTRHVEVQINVCDC